MQQKTLRKILIMALILTFVHGIVGSPGSLGKSQKQDAFEDTGTFKMFIKEMPVGTITSSLDRDGRYKRTMKLAMAGQTVEYDMDITPDAERIWKSIDIQNPAFGKIRATRTDNKVSYTIKGETKSVSLPPDYTLYDDFGLIFESLMLRKYDMQKGGPQTFKRFRVPETAIPGPLIDVEAEYLGEDRRTIGGREWTFLTFNWKVMGIVVKYWTDRDMKIYMTYSPSDQSAGVRDGFEALLEPADTEAQLSKADFDVTKKTLMVPLRDGVRLATDVYFPQAEGTKLPVILIRTPYKKEMSEVEGYYYAKRGYATAIQDVRGRFASEGDWEPFVNEAEDGYDSIEWLARQEWSAGKIGMIGSSYLGWTQLWAAAEKPPHLVTIIPNVAPPDPFFNIPYEYGSFFTLAALWWAEIVEREATAELSMKTFLEINNRRYAGILDDLPVIDIDKKIFGKENPYWRKWIIHNVNDAYWEKANYLDKMKDLDIPVFLQSGWYDGDGIGTKLAYLRLKKSKNKHIKLIVGPWEHTDTSSSSARGHDVGEEAVIDLQRQYLRWFDFWLKGVKNGILEEPLVSLYVIGSKIWLHANTYPLPQTRFQKLYLTSVLGANTLRGDGKLVPEIPAGQKEYDSYTYDPADPTPAWSFRFSEGGREGYEKITSTRRDILVFETKPLDKPLTLAGPLTAKIYASSSAVDTDWFVSFYIVTDKEEHIPMTPHGKGTVRARFRNSTRRPELLERGRVYEYDIDLWHTGWTLESGWKLRVEVSSAFFPYFSRNLNTGGHNEMETAHVPAQQRIYHSEKYPSHIVLPVIEIMNGKESIESPALETHKKQIRRQN